MEFMEAVRNRRSVYAIGSGSPIADDEISEIVRKAVEFTPSAFNSQTSRVVLLLGSAHQKLWDITKDTLRAMVSPERFGATEQKLNSFAAGHGTILFFEEQDTVAGLQKQFPSYADNFPLWSLQSSGMLQHVIWTALEEAGLGASLQHYNPVIDASVAAEFGIPSGWKLWAEMPFGEIKAAPDAKAPADLSDRVRVIG